MIAVFALALLSQEPTEATLDTAEPANAVALAIQPAVGLTEGEMAQSQKKLEEELTGLGVVVTGAGAVDPGCVPDPACVENARASEAGGPRALLVVELVRLGPVVQLTATGASGDKRATGSHGLDEAQLAKGPLLPDNVRAWVKSLAGPAKVEPIKIVTPPVEKKPGFSAVQSGALFAGGIGAIALVAGVILVATSEPVLEDKKSTGPAKEQAVTLGWVGVGASAVGVAGVAAGAVLFFVVGGGLKGGE